MSKTLLAAIAGVVLGAALSLAAQGPPVGVPINFERVWSLPSTGAKLSYDGRADTLSQVGSVTTYRGNVTISFPTERMVVHADEVTSDPATKDLALQGNVRITFDWPGGRK
jgi:lipopolysaccharide assembly outer membrane protein LptD (OstA)